MAFFFHESDRKLGVSSRKSGSNIMLSKAYQKSHPSLIPALFFFLSTILFVFRLNKHDKTLHLMPWNKMAHGTGSGWRGWRWGWGCPIPAWCKTKSFSHPAQTTCMWQNVFTPICHRQHGFSSGRCSQVTWEMGRRATKRLAKVTPTQWPILFNGVAHLAHMHLPPHYAAHRAACAVVSLPIMSLELFFFFFSRQIKSSWLQNVQ